MFIKSEIIDFKKGGLRNKEELFCVKLVLFCVVWHLITGLSCLWTRHAHNCEKFFEFKRAWRTLRKCSPVEKVKSKEMGWI